MGKLIPMLAFCVFIFCVGIARAQNITTVAGLGSSADTAKPFAVFLMPREISVDAAGNVFVSDSRNMIWKYDLAMGRVIRYAGQYSFGFSGDSGASTLAFLSAPAGSVSDASGNFYFVDEENYRIRKVNSAGIITTIAGTGTPDFGGDGGVATDADMIPTAVTIDAAGNLYVVDYGNSRIRKISTAGIITTIAGTGIPGYSGDGGPATLARLDTPYYIAINHAGEIVFSDSFGTRIRKISTSGIISTIAGNGKYTNTGDGGHADTAGIIANYNFAIDQADNIYFSQDFAIRKIDTAGIITRFAGSYGVSAYAGDGGPAGSALFRLNGHLASDNAGNIFVGDYGAYVVRKINTAGIISTYFGNNFLSYSGDGDSVIKTFMEPTSISFDTIGNMYFTDVLNYSVRKVDAATGITSRIAGTGTTGYSGDTGLGKFVQVTETQVASDKAGNVYIADKENQRIRKVTTDGVIHTIAGTGGFSYSGDGGPAINATMKYPMGILIDDTGNVIFADNYNHCARKINTSGIISTIAGKDTAGYNGDSIPAVTAKLNGPTFLAKDTHGNIYVSDAGNNRIRKIDTNGKIYTVAGNGTLGCAGNGFAATSAFIDPLGLCVDRIGNIYFSNRDSSMIRKVDTFGIISKVAGDDLFEMTGDGGPAIIAGVAAPTGMYADKDNNIYLADYNRIRFICAHDSIAPIATVTSTFDTICAGTTVTFNVGVVNPGSSPAYQWLRNSIAISGATTSHYTSSTLVNGDIIKCRYSNVNLAPCAISGTTSNPVTMTVYSVSPSPSGVVVAASPGIVTYSGETITYTASVVNGGAAPTYQWSKNSVAIPGATSNPYVSSTVNNGDVISVKIITSNRCATPDYATGSFITGVDNVPANKYAIDLYPNPNNGDFVVRGNFGVIDNKAAITITDLFGNVIYSADADINSGLLSQSIHLGGQYPAGVYFLQIIFNGQKNNFKFMLK